MSDDELRGISAWLPPVKSGDIADNEFFGLSRDVPIARTEPRPWGWFDRIRLKICGYVYRFGDFINPFTDWP